jgi:hypothetical protein
MQSPVLGAEKMQTKVDPAEIEKLLGLLSTTPQRLAACSTGIDPSRLSFKSEQEPWSANDILAHLRACADVWGKSMLAMITQDHPTLRYVSPRTWIRKTNYIEQEFLVSLQAFSKKRDELLSVLKALRADDWLRGATFTATTKGREQTVLTYAQRMTHHENEHCDQIEVLLRN